LANDESGYRDFCRSFAAHFTETNEASIAEHVCKACLIVPGALDLDQLPHEVFAKALDEQTLHTGLVPWHWGSRALVAYRAGDPDSAIAYVQKSQESNSDELMQMINSSILALAYHHLGQPGMSYRNWKDARRQIDRFVNAETGFPKGHDALIAGILAQEARSLLLDSQSSIADTRADWLQTVATDPEISAAERFQILNDFGDWSAASKVGWQIVEQSPGNTEAWLKLAPVLVLGGNEEAYRDFCSRMVKQFEGTDDVQIAERTCKACLLIPNSIELSQLPIATLASSLDQDGTSGPAEWFWLARALAAYRNNDAESAVHYVQESEQLSPGEITHALNLSIRALALAEIGKPEESRREAAIASKIVKCRSERDYNLGNHHDLLMTKILLREVQASDYGARSP
ncbi:MAG: hypothetical protein N2C12_14295, partial [Planctomycetales bacterium]